MERRTAITQWSDPDLEQQVLEAVSLDVPWKLVEDFSTLVRLSGSAEERRAVELIIQELEAAGVPYRLYEPECFISIPLSASVRTLGPGGRTFRAKTPAMSVSTDGEEIIGELVYVPSVGGSNAGDVFSAGVDLGGQDVRGKIVLTEGMASPGKVADVMAAGAMAGIFINPGEAIHEGICTTIWGTPDLDSMGRQPSIPVVAVNNPDGQALLAAAQQGAQVALATKLDTGWRTIPVLVAEIPGAVVPEEFVLLHGHLDSWHVGIGDNATGDATLLELARVFWQFRDRLARSLRIAWWSGHSHGRYAGSTWYADTFAIDLARNCVAQVNCDSPGCRWTTTYNNLTAMSETEPFIDTVIRATTGITPQPERPPRAGDYSFNGIGITSFYMLSSTMSDEDRAAKGYYAVGGCGGNIQWHTEGDTLEIADREYLLRDMRMYAASVLRTLNAPLVPFDWTRTTAEFRATLDRYQQAAGDHFDFGPAREAVAALEGALERFYAAAPAVTSPADPAARRFNFVQRRLARLLIPVNYSRMEAFRHDPALNVPPLPDLAPALAIPQAAGDVAQRGILRAHLTRGQNRLVWALEQAREVVEAATA
ncbi:MAG: M28 family peptidase [Sphaerobacter sp.]|nr:M28 family peptidase [Sphaerobacter sp.]